MIKETNKDLFIMDKEKYYLAHCISSDCKMGAGIAVEFNKRFNLRRKLLQYPIGERRHPTCILEDNIFNLITKKRFFHKPTYFTLEKSLLVMKGIMIAKNIRHIAMPKIGSGLDNLNWNKVKSIIEDVFDGMDVEIVVCYL